MHAAESAIFTLTHYPAGPVINAPGGVVSYNQQGGITAGTVNIVGSTATHQVESQDRNVKDGDRYRSTFTLRINSPQTFGQLKVGVFGRTVVDRDLGPMKGGPMAILFGKDLSTGPTCSSSLTPPSGTHSRFTQQSPRRPCAFKRQSMLAAGLDGTLRPAPV